MRISECAVVVIAVVIVVRIIVVILVVEPRFSRCSRMMWMVCAESVVGMVRMVIVVGIVVAPVESVVHIVRMVVVGTVVPGIPPEVVAQIDTDTPVARIVGVPVGVGIERVIIAPSVIARAVEPSQTGGVGIVVVVVHVKVVVVDGRIAV